jgi:hypothetical protein
VWRSTNDQTDSRTRSASWGVGFDLLQVPPQSHPLPQIPRIDDTWTTAHHCLPHMHYNTSSRPPPCPALPAAVVRALGHVCQPVAVKSPRLRQNALLLLCLLLPMLCRQTTALTARLALAGEGYRRKRLGNLQAKGFRLVFPAWGPASISVELYPLEPLRCLLACVRAVSCRHPLVPFRTYWRRRGKVRWSEVHTIRYRTLGM